MTQLTLDLCTPSPVHLSALRTLLTAYTAACEHRDRMTDDRDRKEAQAVIDANELTFAHVAAIDAMHSIWTLQEHIKEALYTYETGYPGREVWSIRPLEPAEMTVARAFRLLTEERIR